MASKRLGREAQAKRLLPIKRAGSHGIIPLSFAQQRLWFLEQLGQLGPAYHITECLRFRGTLHREALHRALARMVARHEVLRTTIEVMDGVPYQRIRSQDVGFFLQYRDLRGEANCVYEAEKLLIKDGEAPFELDKDMLIRGSLVRVAENVHLLSLTAHHIVSDGWSMGILLEELGKLYCAFSKGEEDPLPELPIQYADFAVWQRDLIRDGALEHQATYWLKTLQGAPEILHLPADHPRPVQMDYRGASVRVAFDAELTGELKALSRRNSVTLYMTLLAGWAALLGRLSGQRDIVVGTPAASRGRAEIDGLIGFFVNTLALRVNLSQSLSVGELLSQVKTRALEAQRHQDIPFEEVVKVLRPVRSATYAPLIQVMFAWQNLPKGSIQFPGLKVEREAATPPASSRLDLTLFLWEDNGRIVGSVEYATSLFKRVTVARYLDYFRRLLEGMVADDTQRMDRIPLIDEAEHCRIVEEWSSRGSQ